MNTLSEKGAFMFLAIREIRHSPTRFILIATIIFLVSYLVYFLAGLAFGLATAFSGVIDNWNVTTVAVSETANKNLLTSRISASDTQAVTDTHHATPIFVRASVYETPTRLRPTTNPETTRTQKSDDNTSSAFLFGVQPGSLAQPTVTEGHFPTSDTDILAPKQLRDNGYALGDTIRLVDSDTTWTISGFTNTQSYQASPAFFIDYTTYAQTFDYALKTRNDTVTAQALLFTDELTEAELAEFEHHNLTPLTTDELKQALPGYTEQSLTFAFMIAALIGIIAFVLGIFIYVLTLQKRSIFGIMKAQGIPTSYILMSGTVQTLILTFFGVTFGLTLAALSGYALSPGLPFKVEPMLWSGVTVAFFVFTLFGALAPIRTISTIDPLEAIG